MYLLRRILLYIFILLLIVSIYKDLSVGQTLLHDSAIEDTSSIEKESLEFKVIKVKVQPGDTVLSIIEKVNNNQLDHLDIQKVMADFKQVNPLVNPYDLKLNSYYYFPVY